MKPRRYAARPAPGLTSWQSHDEVARARRRTAWGIGGLALLAALWLAAFAGDEPGDDTLTGVIVLEVFTLVPLGFLVARFLRLDRLLDRMRVIDADDQRQAAAELEAVDSSIWRVARFAAELPVGPASDAAADAFSAAERASRSWRSMVVRRHHLQSLLALTTGERARRSIAEQLATTNEAIGVLRAQSEELCAALGALVTAAEGPALEVDLRRIREAAERAEALAAGFEEVRPL